MNACSLSSINPLIFAILAIGIIFFLIDNRKKSKNSSAKDILDNRYAKGEIEKDEYEEKLKVLSKEN